MLTGASPGSRGRGRPARRAGCDRASAADTRRRGQRAAAAPAPAAAGQRGVEQHGDPEDDAHLLGRERAGQGEGEEDRHHHRAGGEDHAPGLVEAADHRLVRASARRPSAPWRMRAGRPCSPSRSRRSSRRRTRAPGVEEALRLEAEQSRELAVLEDHLAIAEGGAGGEQVGQTAIAAISGACSATSSTRKPSSRTTPMTSGSWPSSATSRSWVSAAAPPSRAPAGSPARSRSIVAPPRGSTDRAGRGSPRQDHPPPPAGAAGHWRSRIALRELRHRRGLRPRADDLERPRRAGPEGILHLGVARLARSRESAPP